MGHTNVRLTIEEMQEIAKSKGGECLSEKYVNAHSKLEWKCSRGHIWSATPSNIKKASGVQYVPICRILLLKT
jgi:hypothetical protein